VADARARGAKLIVVDPRRIGFAVKADCWLRVQPGTDAAVALAIAGVMIDRGWFDAEFVRNWTNGPFLVRDDDGTMLCCDILPVEGESGGFVASDETRGAPVTYDTAKRRYTGTPDRLAISGEIVVDTREGPIRCRPAFELFAGKCRAMSPEETTAASEWSQTPSGKRRGCSGIIGLLPIIPGPVLNSTRMPRRPTAG
jgi:anaerobic selenocysteine-containing dehydrogenase